MISPLDLEEMMDEYKAFCTHCRRLGFVPMSLEAFEFYWEPKTSLLRTKMQEVMN